MKAKHYHWLHIPSGSNGVEEFDEYHARAAETVLEPSGLPMDKALMLVNKWNAQAATRKYWID